MPIIFYNINWMLFNIFLALLAVLFGYFFLRTKNLPLKFLMGIAWVLFLPNTIYLITDIIHLFEQWGKVAVIEKGILLGQYVLLVLAGIVTFILSVRPFEQSLRQLKFHKQNIILVLVLFQFVIAFGVMLGRVERINSWDVITQPLHVIVASVHIVMSVELVALTVLFGLFCNFVYFLLRNVISIDK